MPSNLILTNQEIASLISFARKDGRGELFAFFRNCFLFIVAALLWLSLCGQRLLQNMNGATDAQLDACKLECFVCDNKNSVQPQIRCDLKLEIPCINPLTIYQ